MGPLGRTLTSGAIGVAAGGITLAALMRDPAGLNAGSMVSIPGTALGMGTAAALSRAGIDHPAARIPLSAAVPAVAAGAVFVAATRASQDGDANIGAAIAVLAGVTGTAGTVAAVSALHLLR